MLIKKFLANFLFVPFQNRSVLFKIFAFKHEFKKFSEDIYPLSTLITNYQCLKCTPTRYSHFQNLLDLFKTNYLKNNSAMKLLYQFQFTQNTNTACSLLQQIFTENTTHVAFRCFRNILFVPNSFTKTANQMRYVKRHDQRQANQNKIILNVRNNVLAPGGHVCALYF